MHSCVVTLVVRSEHAEMNINGLSSEPLGWITPWMKSWTMRDEYKVYVILKIILMADDVCGRGLIFKHMNMKVLAVLWLCFMNKFKWSSSPLLWLNESVDFISEWLVHEGEGATSRAMMWWNWRGSCGNSMHALVVQMGENTPAVQWPIFVRDWTDIWPRRHTVVKWTWCTTDLFRMPIKCSLEKSVSCGKTVLIGRSTKMQFALVTRLNCMTVVPWQ